MSPTPHDEVSRAIETLLEAYRVKVCEYAEGYGLACHAAVDQLPGEWTGALEVILTPRHGRGLAAPISLYVEVEDYDGRYVGSAHAVSMDPSGSYPLAEDSWSADGKTPEAALAAWGDLEKHASPEALVRTVANSMRGRAPSALKRRLLKR